VYVFELDDIRIKREDSHDKHREMSTREREIRRTHQNVRVTELAKFSEVKRILKITKVSETRYNNDWILLGQHSRIRAELLISLKDCLIDFLLMVISSRACPWKLQITVTERTEQEKTRYYIFFFFFFLL